MPVRYQTKIVAGRLAARKHGGIFEVSHMGRFIFEGQDKLNLLQHTLTNDCRALEPRQAQYTIIAEPAGLVAEVMLQGRTAKQEVAKLRGCLTRMNYCFDNQAIAELKERLLATLMSTGTAARW